MLMLFISTNLLSVYIYCSVHDLFLCLLTIAICFCAFVVTQWFCPVCIKHHSCTWLGIRLFWFQTFILCIMLDMFYILFTVIVDSWDVNKISVNINQSMPFIMSVRLAAVAGGAGNADSQCNKSPYSGTQYKGQPVYQVTLASLWFDKFTRPPCCYC